MDKNAYPQGTSGSNDESGPRDTCNTFEKNFNKEKITLVPRPTAEYQVHLSTSAAEDHHDDHHVHSRPRIMAYKQARYRKSHCVCCSSSYSRPPKSSIQWLLSDGKVPPAAPFLFDAMKMEAKSPLLKETRRAVISLRARQRSSAALLHFSFFNFCLR